MTLNNANNQNGFGPRPSNLRTRTISQSSDEENHRFTTNNNNEMNDKSEKNNLNVLSPFDENEEWAKISEIMASFGSGIVRESVFVNDIENEFKTRLGMKTDSSNGSLASHTENLPPFKQWLHNIKLEHLEEYFVENGYDQIEFLNEIITENDLLVMGIPENDRKSLLEAIEKLTIPPTIIELQNNKIHNNGIQNSTLTVDQWLKSIQLEEYSEIFR